MKTYGPELQPGPQRQTPSPVQVNLPEPYEGIIDTYEPLFPGHKHCEWCNNEDHDFLKEEINICHECVFKELYIHTQTTESEDGASDHTTGASCSTDATPHEAATATCHSMEPANYEDDPVFPFAFNDWLVNDDEEGDDQGEIITPLLKTPREEVTVPLGGGSKAVNVCKNEPCFDLPTIPETQVLISGDGMR